MIARILNESVLMKNKDRNVMEKIIINTGFDQTPGNINYRLSDGTPGNWFIADGERGKVIFISHSFLGPKGTRDRIIYIFHTDWNTDWEIEGFGKPVPETNTEGIKEMSANMRKVMNILSRKSSVGEMIKFINNEHEKNFSTVWGKSK